MPSGLIILPSRLPSFIAALPLNVRSKEIEPRRPELETSVTLQLEMLLLFSRIYRLLRVST